MCTFCLSLPDTLPSSLSQEYSLLSQNSSIRSIIFTIWENINTYNSRKESEEKGRGYVMMQCDMCDDRELERGK